MAVSFWLCWTVYGIKNRMGMGQQRAPENSLRKLFSGPPDVVHLRIARPLGLKSSIVNNATTPVKTSVNLFRPLVNATVFVIYYSQKGYQRLYFCTVSIHFIKNVTLANTGGNPGRAHPTAPFTTPVK